MPRKRGQARNQSYQEESKVLELTQDDAAKKAGLTQGQIARLENSSQIPRVEEAAAVQL